MKRKTFKISIISGLLLILSSSFSEKAQAGEIIDAKVIATSLNVRSEPGLHSSVVGSLPYGTSVSISEESYGWAKINYDRASGWVAGYYLQKLNALGSVKQSKHLPPSKVSFSHSNPAARKIGTVSADALRMREGPGLDSKILHVLPAGTQLEITGRQADWLQAKTSSGKSGWVLGSYVGERKNGSVAKANRTPGLKGKVIVIDPGHGGNDTGAIGKKFSLEEKTLNLQTSRHLADRLRQAGARVIMTRTEDTQKPALFQRVEVSETRDADAFISLHYNSSPKSNTGTLTFYYSEEKDLSLASTIEARLARGLGLKSNGISFGDYHVLRENARPSVLIELGFLTNPKDEAIIRTSGYQQKAAKAIVDGLRDYFGE